MSEIRVGQKVTLNFITDDGEEHELNCQVKGIFKDRLVLTNPDELAVYKEYFYEGCELTTSIYTPMGIKVFDTIILDSPLESNFVIEYIENSREIQRREYVRVEFGAKIVIVRDGEENVVAKTIDVSGGGIKFSCNRLFSQDEVVDLSLFLPTLPRAIQAKGTILLKEHIPSNQYILLFSKIDERDRDKIIKTCFEIQQAKYRTFDRAE